jgi:ribosome-associated protein
MSEMDRSARDADIPLSGGNRIPAGEIVEQASRSSGPGGQHVNKSNTRVTLRWNVAESSQLTDTQRRRLRERLGGRVTRSGDLVVHAATRRSRAQNRTRARERLAELVRDALRTTAPRVATKPSRRVVARTLDEKRRRSATKQARRRVRRDDE